ncbi:hypothetical protein AXF42_Ash016638 [Apostasia shenzhenica]|uniref:Reverse transcriptase/retrotransposon-derived protein RNase H-like domain-containing protein n=1 Tax=Apostasia shenzhenica TaxID=1088818 RepID=A0A2I0A1M8_9ASPA|nr:hypothetical protein AXF42_Ash016638 [Apostasia shenzhenica]
MGDRCLPFFKVLRENHPTWNDDCQRAFNDLKKYLLSPPLLSAPIPGKDLLLYIGATDGCVSAVLAREDVGTASHILCLSRPPRRRTEVSSSRETLFCSNKCCSQAAPLFSGALNKGDDRPTSPKNTPFPGGIREVAEVGCGAIRVRHRLHFKIRIKKPDTCGFCG